MFRKTILKVMKSKIRKQCFKLATETRTKTIFSLSQMLSWLHAYPHTPTQTENKERKRKINLKGNQNIIINIQDGNAIRLVLGYQETISF